MPVAGCCTAEAPKSISIVWPATDWTEWRGANKVTSESEKRGKEKETEKERDHLARNNREKRGRPRDVEMNW